MKRHMFSWLAMVVLVLVLAACAPAAAPTPAATPAPTATPGPGGTPTPPRAVATPTPMASPAPQATATPIPTPSPTAAPAGPRIGGTIRHPQRDDLYLDPSRQHADSTSTTKYLVFTELFTMWTEPPQNCQKAVYPRAVKSWRWADDTTAEFTLKEGIRYHKKPPVNGREMVASDMVPSFQRYQKNLLSMAGKSALVESVTVKDKYTFQMKLKLPWGGLVQELLAPSMGRPGWSQQSWPALATSGPTPPGPG